MIASINESSTPLLAFSATLYMSGKTSVVEGPSATLTFHDENAPLLGRVANRLDGATTVTSIAQEAGVDVDRLRAILTVLAHEGLLVDASAPSIAQSPEEFINSFVDLTEIWAQEIFSLPFWQVLLAGDASRELVLGWGIEFYHYIESANEYMAAGVASCRDDVLSRRWLAEHYVEEHDHSGIFLNGLVRCGLEEHLVRKATPLASTRAIINYMNEVARSDSLAYAGTFAVMQAPRPAERRQNIDHLYDRLDSLYPYAKGLFDAFREHVSIDEKLGHEELVLSRIVSHCGVPDHRRSEAILQAARGLVEHFLLFFDGIHEFYGNPASYLPRRALDIRSVLAK